MHDLIAFFSDCAATDVCQLCLEIIDYYYSRTALED